MTNAPEPENLSVAEFMDGCSHIGTPEFRLLIARYIKHYFKGGVRVTDKP